MPAYIFRILLAMLCAALIVPLLIQDTSTYRQAVSLSTFGSRLDDIGGGQESLPSPDDLGDGSKSELSSTSGESSEPEDSPEQSESPEPEDESRLDPPSESEDLSEPESTPSEMEPEAPQESETEGNGESDAEFLPVAPPDELPGNERVVTTFVELKSALSENNGVTVVHLGADITIGQAGGIPVHAGKQHVILDGIDPGDPAQDRPYTLTDYPSAAFTDTIYIESSGIKSMIVRDLNIVGKNYYGPVGVRETALTDEFVLTFERVNYSGPQIGHHRRGSIYFIDCTVHIHDRNGGSPKQEFAEAKHLFFRGANTIDTETSATSIFWHPLGGTFEIGDDSSLSVTATGLSAAYGAFYADGVAYNIDMAIGARAVFDATISTNLVWEDGQATLRTLTVGEGGAFHLTATRSTSRPVMTVGGTLTIEKGAAFTISGFGGGNVALLQKSGMITLEQDAVFQMIADAPYVSLIELRGSTFQCNDPSSVLLYNANRDIRAWNSAGQVKISAQQINYWDTLPTNALDDPPRNKWEKADKANFTLEGALSAGAAGNFTDALTSNHTTEDPGTAPTPTSFSMNAARVLAWGRLELSISQPTTSSSSIHGVTAPGATVRVSFSQQGADYVLQDVSADHNGIFTVPVEVPLEARTEITVISSYAYLTAHSTVTVNDEGNLVFTVPSTLHFYTTELAPTTQTIERLESGWRLAVVDTRGMGQTWKIFVRMLQPLTASDPSIPILDGALIFVGETGKATQIGDMPLQVYQHTTTSGNELVDIEWNADQGILARVPTGAAYADRVYAGVIEWSLYDAP